MAPLPRGERPLRPAGWLRRRLDGALSALARLTLGVFFREVEVVGAETVPRDRPILIVANHVNSLVDPILILGFAGARPRFLAKSTLWSHPVVGPLLVLGGAVPVYRRQDHVDVSRNFDTFARCRLTLAAGGAIAVFPEGTSHNQPHPLPLKTGAARIALETEFRHGPLGLRIVPVGLTYEAKGRFRSRVLLLVGQAIDPAPEAARYAAGGRAAVRELTARIARGLDAVTLSFASWEEARLIDRAAPLIVPPGPGGGTGTPLSETWTLRKAVVTGYRSLMTTEPEQAAAVAAEVSRYDRTLEAFQLKDEEVAPDGRSPAGRSQTREAFRSLLVLPVALVGTLLNWLPYRLPGWVAFRLTKTPDEPATYKLLTALLAFPVMWAAEVVVAALLGGPWWALGMAVAAPVTGYAALWFHEQRGRFFPHKDRPAVAFPVHETVLQDIRRQRAELQRRLLALASRTGAVAAAEPGDRIVLR